MNTDSMYLKEIKQLLTDLEGINKFAYEFKRIPNETDGLLKKIVSTYLKLSESGRKQIIDLLPMGKYEYYFGRFSERMASLALRSKNAEYLRYGIVADAMMIMNSELLIIHRVLSLFSHASEEIGVDFSEMRRLYQDSIPIQLKNIQLPSSFHVEHLESIGYHIIHDEDGPKYISTESLQRSKRQKELIIDATLELELFLEEVKANYSSMVGKYRKLFQIAQVSNDEKMFLESYKKFKPHLYGGMGSLNDLGIYKDNNHQVDDEKFANERLKYLLEKLKKELEKYYLR